MAAIPATTESTIMANKRKAFFTFSLYIRGGWIGEEKNAPI